MIEVYTTEAFEGEVIATFDYVDDILRCTSVTLIPRKELDKFDLDTVCENRSLFKSLLLKKNYYE